MIHPLPRVRRTMRALPFALCVACTGDGASGEGVAMGDTTAARAVRDSVAMPRDHRDTASLAVEVDVTRRTLRVLGAGGDTVAVHPVAVGSPEWPTRPGTWSVDQVVLNPAWIPPDETWAEEREPREPGDPRNPLGRAQLVYDLPRSIHGTDDPSSIGKAVSHGSIRVTNDVAWSLAELLLRETGVGDADSLLAAARRDSTTKIVVDLPRVVPIRVR